jgi:pimeloyl-ACP methyl ester carboxylesterase
MIFVHGAGLNERIWPYNFRDFPNALFPTLKRNLGEPPSVHLFTHYLKSYTDRHSLDTVVLTGHSLGAGVALDYALTYPHTVDGLILISASPKFQVPEQLLHMILTDYNQFIETLVNMGFHQNAPENVKGVFRSIMLEMSPEEVHFDYSCANTFDVGDKISDISVPSLVITPENDMMIPLQISKSLADHLENSQFTLIPQAGHMVILEQPARVAREIRAFVDHLL